MAEFREPWKECTDWLVRCNVLRQDHKTNWSDASVSDLAHTLRDGVLLCNLLNTLDPGCIDMKNVSQKPQMAQFLCLRNIKTFLQACRESFSLKDNELFEPSVLFELSDFYKVLSTLSKLSNSLKAQRKHIEGFSVHKNRSVSQEDLYKNLNSNDDEGHTLSPFCEEVDYGGYYSLTKNEEIYQDLCSINRSSPLQVPAAQSLEKRDYVINELVETEKNYVEVLSNLQKHFIRPLSSILKEEDIKIIFGNIKELAEIHAGFHSQLRKATTGNCGVKLSDVFLNWREKFLIYGDYCANLTRAQDLIQELCRNQHIDHAVNKCQQEANNGKFKLRDILSVPMQRILKYHLLLDKLISDTQPNHEDYRGLERAKEAMVDVAQYINEVKRDSDTLSIVKHIEENITDLNMPENTSLKDYGRLLRDGEMRIKAHDNQKTKFRYVFIFDKVILLCKVNRGDQYTYRGSLQLSDYILEDPKSRPTLRKDTRFNYHWFLIHKVERSAYTMYVRSEDMKRKWIRSIQEALDNIEPSCSRMTDHKVAIHTFSKPTTCIHCSKYLKGIIFQGYKCEKCNIAAHKSCIPLTGRCGIRQAPELPPRPPASRLVPPSINGDASNWADQISIEEHLWFVGEMGRDTATRLLEDQEDETFVVRIRPQGPTHSDETSYALSLKADDRVKHMKVYERLREGVVMYYLSESRFFKSIVDLINCYEHSSLAENFSGLDKCLRWPLRQIVAVAEFDYNPPEASQLPLKKGCHVIIISKEGDSKGWWKGKVNDKVGFFPKNYVREVSETFKIRNEWQLQQH